MQKFYQLYQQFRIDRALHWIVIKREYHTSLYGNYNVLAIEIDRIQLSLQKPVDSLKC